MPVTEITKDLDARIAAYNAPTRLRRLHAALPNFPDQIVLVYRADQPKTRAARFVKDAIINSGHEMPSVGVTAAE